MKYGKVLSLMKSATIVIPIYLYQIFPKLDIDLETFLFLMYLRGKGNKFIFDIKLFSEEFAKEVKTILQYISLLQEKKLITLDVVKNDKNITEEYISLEPFYEKISLDFIDKVVESPKEETNFFEILEAELGKPLTPIEYEIVKEWKRKDYSDEIIKEAIREAVYSGVFNLRYIDKILFEWARKGMKTKEDVERNRRDFREKEKNKKVEIFDYDFMEDFDHD